MSFLFKLLHNLLATQDCLSKMNQDTSSACRADGCSGDIPENLMHIFFFCPFLNGIVNIYLEAVREFIPYITMEDALLLQFEVDPNMELAIGKHPKMHLIKIDLESHIRQLRQAKCYVNDVLY